MTQSDTLCAICGEGTLTSHTGTNAVEYKGQSAQLEFNYSICDVCGCEQSDAKQLRMNKRAMTAFKKRVDGLLVGAEIRSLREQLRLNQAEAAQIFGGGPVAFCKYEKDEVSQSDAMDRLLRVARDIPDVVSMLALRAGVRCDSNIAEWQNTVNVQTKGTEPRRCRLRVVSSSNFSLDSQDEWAA